MADTANNRELSQLILAACADEASEQQFDELEQLLKSDASARSMYTDLMLLQAQLGWSAISDPADGGLPPRFPREFGSAKLLSAVREAEAGDRSASRKSPHVSLAGWATDSGRALAAVAFSPITMAAMVLLIIGLWWSQREIQDLRGQLAKRESSNASVAYLSSANGCDWGDELHLHPVGSPVDSSDDITLYEGIAEYRLGNGVYVNVEAPASLVINSSSSVVLLYGKVTLNVPWEVASFRVIAGPCHFAARDAEFGVNHQGSNVEMHVFAGEVRATSPTISYAEDTNDQASGGTVVTDDTGMFGRAVITAGSAISLLNDDGVVKVAKMGFKAMPELFATKLSMSGALPATGDYVRAVRESKPIGYWRFEHVRNGYVPNEIKGGVDLKVVREVSFVGDRDNRAAEFRPGLNSVLFSDAAIAGAEEIPNYSMEAWIKPGYMHLGGFVSLVSDLPGIHASTLEIQGSAKSRGTSSPGSRHPGSIRYVHNNLLFKGVQDAGTNCFSSEPYLIRRWQHVVAAKDRSTMRLYLNGKLVGTARDKSALSANSRLAVGQDTCNYQLRNFVGRIDEVAFYNRALPENEINEHFQSIDWEGPSGVRPIDGI